MPRINKPLPEYIHPFLAEVALEAYRVVSFGDADGYVDYQDAGDMAVGVTLHAAEAGKPVQVVMFGPVLVRAGAAVAMSLVRDGAVALGTAGTGKVTAATLGTAASNKMAVGRFLGPAAAVDDLVPVFVFPPLQILTA